MQPDLNLILSHFDIEGHVESISPFGSGHINDSFRVVNRDKSKPNYLLQRINHHVFRDVPGMMNNIHEVTKFLYEKYENEGLQDARDRVLCLIKTKDGNLFVQVDGSYWRLYLLLEDFRSWDIPESSEQIYEGARAFGQFTADLKEFNAKNLTTTIPFFHHMPHRLRQFQTARMTVEQIPAEEQKLVDFIVAQSEEMCLLQRLMDNGKLPLRVTHNDTKFNNVLFDKDGNAKCVIDLDTVMPGLIHFDFGDGARTGTNTAAEDEPDISLVDIDMDAFTAYTNGFLDATRPILTRSEADLLVEGAMMMTFIMGVRFLTDYFDGNKYYKTAYPQHNLDRARCQLEFTRKMLLRKTDLVSIVNKFI